MIPSGYPLFLDSDFTLRVSSKVSSSDYFDPTKSSLMLTDDITTRCFIDSISISGLASEFPANSQMLGLPTLNMSYSPTISITFVVSNDITTGLSPFHTFYEQQFSSNGNSSKYGLSLDKLGGYHMYIDFKSARFTEYCQAYHFVGVRFSYPNLSGSLNTKGSTFIKYSVTATFRNVSTSNKIEKNDADALVTQNKNQVIFEAFQSAFAGLKAGLSFR